MYWLWMPIVHCLSLALGIVLFYQWIKFFDIGSGMWPGVYELVLFMSFYSFIISPVISFLYAKRIRGMGWWKYPCVVYNAVLSGGYLFFTSLPPSMVLDIMSCITDTDHSAYFMIGLSSNGVLITSFLCGIVTLVIYDVKRKRSCEACADKIV